MLYLQWKKWTYKQYYDDANTTAKGFIKLGLEPRKTVAILGFNAPEWFISEMGAIFAGKLNIRLEQYAEICEADPYIMCSAEQSSAYCHYFFFLVATTTQYPPLGVNTVKYATNFSVLWRRKT